MSKSPQQPLPHAITQKLSEVRQVLRGYLTKQTVAMIVCWVLAVYWLGAAIDYLPVRVGSDETPRGVRIALLVVMVAGAVWLFFGWLLPRLLRPISDSSLAVLIERRQPELANSLITAVQVSELETDVVDPVAHRQMLDRVLVDASQRTASVDVQRLFNWRPVRLFQIIAVLGILLTAIIGAAAWPWLRQWNSRLFALSDTPWPRQASLRVDWLQLPLPTFTGQLSAEQLFVQFEDGTARVPTGASPRLQISADTSSPRVPEVCTLYYRSDEGTRGRANLRRLGSPRDGWQQFNLDGPPLDTVSAGLSIDVIGLDARLRNLRLDVVDPVVVLELKLDCRYPTYLLDALSTRPPRELLSYRTGMKIPEGTDCTLIGHCSADLSSVDYVLNASTSEDPSAEFVTRQATVKGSEFRIPLEILSESAIVEIRLRDAYGLPSDEVLRYNIMVQEDSVPEVQSRLEGIGLAVTPRAFLPVRGKVTDDHAIAQVGAEMSFNETVLPLVPLELSDTDLTGVIDLEQMAARGLAQVAPGATIGLTIRAKDYYDLNGSEHLGRSQPQQLAVVTPDQLLVVLDRQELELRQRLEQVIDELKQLDDMLDGLQSQLVELDAAGISHVDRMGLVSSAIAVQPPGDEANATEDSMNRPAQRQATIRLAILRAQQGQLQSDKSRQELSGVVNRVENLRLQLVNNRIDSVDRQQRLLEQVQKPLSLLLEGTYTQLDRQMSDLQSKVASGQGRDTVIAAEQSLSEILVTLESIKASMLDIESFNEIVDLVRNLLDEQERILKETQEAQKARVLDLFN